MQLAPGPTEEHLPSVVSAVDSMQLAQRPTEVNLPSVVSAVNLKNKFAKATPWASTRCFLKQGDPNDPNATFPRAQTPIWATVSELMGSIGGGGEVKGHTFSERGSLCFDVYSIYMCQSELFPLMPRAQRGKVIVWLCDDNALVSRSF